MHVIWQRHTAGAASTLSYSVFAIMVLHAAKGRSSQDTHATIHVCTSTRHMKAALTRHPIRGSRQRTRIWGKEDGKAGDSPHHTSPSRLNPFTTSTRCRMGHRHNLPRQRFKVPVYVAFFSAARVNLCKDSSCAHTTP
ncbi:hypothetical protein GGI35DRAFT_123054 [Trichoderma velutinum]